MKFTLPYGDQRWTIEDLDDLKWWARNQQIKHLGTIERQVGLGFILLLVIGASVVAYVHLNRTPTRIEKRNDQEAGF